MKEPFTDHRVRHGSLIVQVTVGLRPQHLHVLHHVQGQEI